VPNLTLPLILTYASGIVTFPLTQRLFGSLFSELRGRWQSSIAARRVIDTQLDPLLKAADELQGKLRSLADEDFRDFRTLPNPIAQKKDMVNLCSTLYLFAQFWGRLEILRRESFHADLAQNKRGEILLAFLRSLESRRVRLVDRAWQRAIGHLTTRLRPAYPNKLSDQAKRDLVGRVFGVYLPDVRNTTKYVGNKKTHRKETSDGFPPKSLKNALGPPGSGSRLLANATHWARVISRPKLWPGISIPTNPSFSPFVVCKFLDDCIPERC
jgi:hypothetical protein